MKRIIPFILSLSLLASLLTGCGGSAAVATDDTTPDTGATSDAASTPEDAVQPTQDGDAEALAFVFSDDGIATGAEGGFQIDGTTLTIESAGSYTVSGSCADGSIRIKKGVTGVTLTLDGLSLTNANSAPIVCGKSSGVTIVAAADSENFLSDTAQNNDDDYPENEDAENAVIKCKDGSQVTLCGTGALTIEANGKNGIKSGATTDEEGEAWLDIQSLALTITAVNDAINAEQQLTIPSGTLTISAGDDAIHADYTLTVGAAGSDGPAIQILACYEGLEAANLSVCSGTVELHASDDCLNAANSGLQGYAFTLDISGGTLIMDTTSGDGIDSNGTLTISGGTVVVWTANTADNQPLDADGTISITGGTVLAAGGSAGMGMTLNAGQPYLRYGADFMSGGFGSFSGFGGGSFQPGEAPAQPGDSSEAPADMPTPPDGATLPEGEAPERPDGETPSFPGGEAPSMPGSGTQSQLGIQTGSSICILDAEGNNVYSGTALCSANFLFFSSAALTDGASYTLQVDGATVAEAEASAEATQSSFGPGGR